MTPPDSGEMRRAGKSHLHVGKECGPSCPDGKGIEFKPDSGEREVKSLGMRFLSQQSPPPAVVLPADLAQRILAALEGSLRGEPTRYEDMEALAAELRAIVERKT